MSNHAQKMEELISKTTELCEAMSVLLKNENSALKDKNVKIVEANLKEKRHIAIKLETALKQLHLAKETGELTGQTEKLKPLQVALDGYRNESSKNVKLLQAIHQSTVGFIQAVRDAVIAKRPKAQTYTKEGATKTDTAPMNLVNKSV